MPIIYMHGVNTRDPKHFEPVKEYLRNIVAPAISRNPDKVSIQAADWFQLCAAPKWDGVARPRTKLTGQGAVAPDDEMLDALVAKAPRVEAQPSAFTSGSAGAASSKIALNGLSAEAMTDLITLAASKPTMTPVQRARIGVIADKIAHDANMQAKLSQTGAPDQQWAIVAAEIQRGIEAQSTFASAGALDVLRDIKERIQESASRLINTPAVGLSVAAGELRPALNDFVTRFLGDVLYYVSGRGTAAAPGPIPAVLIKALETAQTNKQQNNNEPIVLLTHSMGGQIAYDTVTSFLPTARSPIKVDYWCAAASQVGYFEELNMFLASDPRNSKATGRPTPVPTANLGKWWNVWDTNDILSFTTKDIFAPGIDDEEYKTGMSSAAAHGGYLERPSFYRQFAEKIKANSSR
ncbi:hypothetical protein [Bradyrhizobium sp.]|uniref:hypothetical protein n=1 Tax=Bradyrhizobium sp. TaxID=376 RepID=UPI004038070F